MKKYNFLFLIIFLMFLVACGKLVDLPVQDNQVWVEFNPKQCFSSPWEKAWLENNGFKHDKYPMGDSALIEPDEAEIIMSYYKEKNIVILQIKSAITQEEVCEACNCPTGATIYALIKEADQSKLIDEGFILS